MSKILPNNSYILHEHHSRAYGALCTHANALCGEAASFVADLTQGAEGCLACVNGSVYCHCTSCELDHGVGFVRALTALRLPHCQGELAARTLGGWSKDSLILGTLYVPRIHAVVLPSFAPRFTEIDAHIVD